MLGNGSDTVRQTSTKSQGATSILDREFYTPLPDQLASQMTTNRQGRGAALDEEQAAHVLHLLRDDGERSYATYRQLLNDPDDPDHDPDRMGLSRELARIGLACRPIRNGIGRRIFTISSDFCSCARIRMLSSKSAFMQNSYWTSSGSGCRPAAKHSKIIG